jgi:preprotein translocase subunit SecF
MELIKHGRVYDFMSIRKYWIALSLILSVVSAILIWKPGPRYGIDFLGGTELTVQFEGAVDTGRIRDTLERLGTTAPRWCPSTSRPTSSSSA